jgi:endonuclease/exonuclease/phosphatase family metal-dependent hydrolase/dienelactone hydrolase
MHPFSTFIVSFAIACLVSDSQTNGQEPGNTNSRQLRVLTYNIHHGQGVDGKLDLQRIAKVIRSASPDMVALQEVDQNVGRSESIDQPALLARLTDMQVVFGGNISLQGGEYGNAVLSKLPILAHQNQLLPRIDNGEQRGVLVTQLRVGRQVLSLLATHFDHRRDDRERLASAEMIKQIALDRVPVPTVLAGDINATRDSPVLNSLTQVWTIAGENEQPTIPVAKPERQIDFVLTDPTDRWRVVKTEVIDEPIASDHRPLLAVLQWLGDDAINRNILYESVVEVTGNDGTTDLATTPQHWQPRRQAIRRAMQSVMGSLPTLTNRSPPTFAVIEETDCGTYVRKKITYRSQPGCDTPAYLCVPKGMEDDKPVPAVLCLHPTDNSVGHDVVVGLGGKPNRQYASELAERGYVTLSPSYPQLANYQPDLAALGWESGTLKAIWDNIRGVDLLLSLPQVDPASIGAIGHSLGGHNSIFTAALDPRIDAVVSSCGFDSFADYYDGNPAVWEPGKGWTQLRYMPRLADYNGRLNEIPFDFDELLAAIAPRNVLVVAPLHDSNFRTASVDRMTTEARKVFALHGHPDRLQVVHPDCQHDFPDEMRDQAYRLFDKVLKHKS